MTDSFFTDVKVKPYVKQYLVNNCGNPVDLTFLPRFNSLLKQNLMKPMFKGESLPMRQDECYVRIQLSKDTFYRYGWELTKSSQQHFNARIEEELKSLARNYIAMRSGWGFSVASSIRKFQDVFNFPEEVWSYDAIKKDLDRNSEAKKDSSVENFLRSMDKKIHNIFLENMSETGTISKRYKNELHKIG